MSLLNDMLRDLERRQPGVVTGQAGVFRDVIHVRGADRHVPILGGGRRAWTAAAVLALAAGYLLTPLLVGGVQQTRSTLPGPVTHPVDAARAGLGGFESLQLAAHLERVPARFAAAAPGVVAPRPPAPVSGGPPGDTLTMLHNALRPAPAGTASTTVTSPSPVVKKPVAASDPHAVARLRYAEATQLAETQRGREADDALRQALQLWPGFTDARVLLIARLLAQGDLDGANEQLQAGLGHTPGDVHLVDLRARWLAASGELGAALQVLHETRPALNEHPDHYALLAALSRQADQHQVAVDIYRELLAVWPDNGIWWLGLAMSLEAAGHADGARQAYARVLDKPGVPADLAAYARQRQQVLN